MYFANQITILRGYNWMDKKTSVPTTGFGENETFSRNSQETTESIYMIFLENISTLT